MSQQNEKWIESRAKRSIEVGLIAVLSPILGSVGLAASALVWKKHGTSKLVSRVDRSLYPGDHFVMNKLGDPEIDDPLLKRLRQAMLDELPQVVSIIKGDMSLVGPRADKPEHIDELFSALRDEALRERWQSARARQKPGIISAYAIHSHSRNLEGDPEYVRHVAVDDREQNALIRAHLDIKDYDNASFVRELRLLGRTARMAVNNYRQYLKR